MIEKYIETDSTFYKRLLAIAVPVILQSLITTGINLADNIMLGQTGGYAKEWNINGEKVMLGVEKITNG